MSHMTLAPDLLKQLLVGTGPIRLQARDLTSRPDGMH